MKLIEELQAHRAANPNTRHYPEALRRGVVAHVEHALTRGERRRDIAQQLGVHLSTIDLWRSAKRRERFVRIEADHGVPAPARVSLVVHAGKVRIEGCAIEDVARLLQALGC
jgi:transposase-like protein